MSLSQTIIVAGSPWALCWQRATNSKLSSTPSQPLQGRAVASCSAVSRKPARQVPAKPVLGVLEVKIQHLAL